jgi:preprotein translocase subunit SecG|uniref:Preprotein translocase SecG subunit n=1 Tax=Cryptomonas gyropyrenoidosa TaxID=233257 RepID=UPI002799BDF5|nr:Preprotein translocase SecG subunit [Cryptomonas gyropyrenoidosa]WFQ82987.1 Preprotein translocase SecG subunit [Cryptomonas gyropyrenoidosa]
MSSILHLIWVISCILVIFLILIHNPKSQNIGNQAITFGGTRTAEENLNKITWGVILVFFTVTITLSILD